jgi:signal transduction histidine kinase
MRRRHRRFWVLFGIAAGAVLAVLVWISDKLLDLEEAETRAQRMKTAVARIDGRLKRMLAPEERRPPAEYRAFYVVERDTYARRDMQKIRKGELLVPSPLLTGSPDFVAIYFEAAAGSPPTSPQVPGGVFLERAEEQGLTPDALVSNQARLDGLAAGDLGVLRARLEEEPRGVLRPFWVGPRLFFARRVAVDGVETLQGFLVDWPVLRDAVLEEMRDLFPDAELRPAPREPDLLTLPVRIDARVPARWTASHTVVAFTWAVALVAAFFAGLAFRRFIAYGEKQRGFASLVTHELRSPLTTFRLYTDLLADDLVKDEEQEATYHRTLQRESEHMARMVENVIALSRLEEGRAAMHRERIRVEDLLDRFADGLRRRAEAAELTLSIDAGDAADATVETDVAAVGQILGNLVENACRYGRSPEQPQIELTARRRDGGIGIDVRDFGPGVPAAVVRRIFRPFERGGRDETDPVRGLGLGLALSRGLARDLGGDLTHDRPAEGGARFRLSL